MWQHLQTGGGGIWHNADNRYIMYYLEVQVHLDPPTGDGWNEPHLPATSEVESAVVVKIEVNDKEGRREIIDEHFVGPMEPGVQQIGSQMKLSDKEQAQLADEGSSRHFDEYEAEV
jgi:hypothetical protein